MLSILYYLRIHYSRIRAPQLDGGGGKCEHQQYALELKAFQRVKCSMRWWSTKKNSCFWFWFTCSPFFPPITVPYGCNPCIQINTGKVWIFIGSNEFDYAASNCDIENANMSPNRNWIHKRRIEILVDDFRTVSNKPRWERQRKKKNEIKKRDFNSLSELITFSLRSSLCKWAQSMQSAHRISITFGVRLHQSDCLIVVVGCRMDENLAEQCVPLKQTFAEWVTSFSSIERQQIHIKIVCIFPLSPVGIRLCKCCFRIRT